MGYKYVVWVILLGCMVVMGSCGKASSDNDMRDQTLGGTKEETVNVSSKTEELGATDGATNNNEEEKNEILTDDHTIMSNNLSEEIWEKDMPDFLDIEIEDMMSCEDLSEYGWYIDGTDGQIENLELFIESPITGSRGNGCVGIWDNTDGQASVWRASLEVPVAGTYQLILFTASPYGEKYNDLKIGNQMYQSGIHTISSDFQPCELMVNLEAGVNDIAITESWGWFYLDGLLLRPAPEMNREIYSVEKKLINPNATYETKQLMSYLVDEYGQHILSGQYQYSDGVLSKEFKAIHDTMGTYPAIMGLDLIDYSPSRVEYGTTSYQIEEAITWHKMGGIVTFAWHWNAPKDLVNTTDTPWWKGFYTEGTTFNLDAALSGQDPEGYELLISDIGAIASELMKLQEAGVPVLWRPLHEASGGWFWWGNYGEENFISLWRLMYHELTEVHGLNNLIWVYNGQAASWYPGDDYVDIISEDIYPAKHDYSSQRSRFETAMSYTDTHKIIALSENGVVPDPEACERDNIMWSFYATWNGEFIVNQIGKLIDDYTEVEQLKKVYGNEKVITLDELPDLSTYEAW